MALLLKKSALLLAVTAIFCVTACRDKNKDNIKAAPPEQWVAMSPDVIYWSDRNIVGAHADDKHLLFFSPELYYIFDTSLKVAVANGPGAPKYYSGVLDFKVGPNFRIYNDPGMNTLTVIDNYQQDQYADCSISDLEFFNHQSGDITSFSTPDDQNYIYVAGTLGKRNTLDSQQGVLNKYRIVKDNNYIVSKELVWSKTFTPRMQHSNFEVEYINTVQDVVFLRTSGWTYRLENSVITDTIRQALKNVVSLNGVLYGSCSWRGYTNPQVICPNGLVRSTDNGRTWAYIGYGDSFDKGTITVLDDKLFLYIPGQIARLDLETGKVIPLNIDGLGGVIRTVNLFNKKIYIGTDAGVYSKSLANFLTPL